MKITSFAVFALVVTALRPAAAQTLSRGDIHRGVQAVRPAVDRCLRAAAISAVVKTRLEVVDGRVAAIQVQDAGAASGCVERVMRRARFPRSPRRMSFLYPFVARFTAPAPIPPASTRSRLTRDQIARGIRGIRPGVDRCRALHQPPVLVTIRFEIANGRVINARGSSHADARTVACVERAVMGAAFPRAPAITVRYPFLLH